jgi:hypothetical protein
VYSGCQVKQPYIWYSSNACIADLNSSFALVKTSWTRVQESVDRLKRTILTMWWMWESALDQATDRKRDVLLIRSRFLKKNKQNRFLNKVVEVRRMRAQWCSECNCSSLTSPNLEFPGSFKTNHSELSPPHVSVGLCYASKILTLGTSLRAYSGLRPVIYRELLCIGLWQHRCVAVPSLRARFTREMKLSTMAACILPSLIRL